MSVGTTGRKTLFVRSFFFRYEGAHCYLYQNDLLSWLMEEAEGPQLGAEDLTKRVLGVNFTAIHVSIVVIWSHVALTGQLVPDNFQCTSKSIWQSSLNISYAPL